MNLGEKIKDVLERYDKRARWFYKANGKLTTLKTLFYLADLMMNLLISIFLPTSRQKLMNFLRDPDMDLVKKYLPQTQVRRERESRGPWI